MNEVKSAFFHRPISMLTGSLVAIATPMRTGGALDLPALGRLIDFHVENGTAGIVVVGTTGESPTVDVDEHCSLIKAAVEFARGRIPVIAGTGGNATSEAIALTEFAKKAGAQSGLSSSRTTTSRRRKASIGISARSPRRSTCRCCSTTFRAAPSPISRTTRSCVLRKVPGIIGIKEASADMGRDAELLKALRAERRDNFAVYSGDDLTALSLLLLGGHGVISVTANVAPKLVAEMCRAALKGDLETARARNDRLLPLHRKLFVEANPIPVKWALAQMGLAENVLRLPLVPLSEQYCDAVRDALREAGCSDEQKGTAACLK
jgi:4-hydroxy-tetrahydrodipicolinate synthase